MTNTNLILLAILITLIGLWPVVLVVGLALLIGGSIMIVTVLVWRVIKYYARNWKNL